MASSNAHELQSIGSRHSNATSRFEDAGEAANFNPEVDSRSLPPTDHGKQAYLVLAGCTLIQAPVWGQHVSSQLTTSC
jgi:hypothetical protein